MAKVKVEVTGAYVDGNAPGATINIEDKSAKYLESVGYVKKVEENPKAEPKAEPKATNKSTEKGSK